MDLCQLNILYLHSHDTGRYVEPYGFSVSTPAIQRFAEQGVTFRQAFCAAPTCSPSRAALMTGQYPHRCGMHGLASTQYGYTLHDYSRYLPRFFRGRGYETALAGMQHVARPPWADPIAELGYDHWLNHDDQGGHQPATTADAAVNFLLNRNAHDRPFFLSVGFGETHRDNAHGGIAHGYDPDLIEEAEHADGRYCQPPPGIPDTPITRADAANLCRGAERLDEKVGRVLDALDEAGLAETTLVILTTDHGLAWPNAKGNLTDQGLGVMLLLRGPEGVTWNSGRVSDALVSHLDLYPTICELAGIEPPSDLDGVSLLPLLQNEAGSLRDAVYGEQGYHCLTADPQRSIRTERYRYTRRGPGPYLRIVDPGPTNNWLCDLGYARSPVGQDLLYDLWFDPAQAHNLAESAEHQMVLSTLKNKLFEHMRELDDPFLTGTIPPPPATSATSASSTASSTIT